jgi:diacylglycerol O-acyltransferase
MEGFDRRHPLWDFTLVEGLEGGRALWIMKAHHVLTDGIGSVQLAVHLFDVDPEHEPVLQHEIPAPEPHDTADLLLDVIEHDVEGAVGLARASLGSVVPGMLRAARHPTHAVSETVKVARSIGRMVKPVADSLSPLMRDRQPASEFRALEVDQDGLAAAARRHGATINDAFLAGITGGMRRYHEVHELEVGRLRVAMPVSLRTDDHEAGGNHVTVMRFIVPVDVTDAGFRMRASHSQVAAIRAEPAIGYTELIAGALSALPTSVIGTMLKRIDFLASNVPGVPVPLHLVGVPVLAFYPFGPTVGSAVNITLMSYAGTCCIGVNTDEAAIPDPDVFLECLAEGFAEVLDEATVA